ncbi:MAG: hypothetical protein ACI9FB_003248 [Candidatus Azotimanducaceae bacterium]
MVSINLKRTFYLTLFLLLSCASPAEQNPIINLESKDAKTFGNALSLWRIDHANARVYLLGSVHALKPEHYPLAKPIERAYNASDNAVFEIDLAKMSSYQIALVMQELASYSGSESLESELSESTMRLLVRYLGENKLDSDTYSQFKPWWVTLQIALFEMSKSGYKTKLGIDQYFQEKARAEGKPIFQLESFQEQIELLAGDSSDVQDLSLKVALIEIDSVNILIAQLVNAWQRGAVDEMHALSKQDEGKYPELKKQMERLLDKRNVKMAKSISHYLGQDGSYFVVVGALHMGGPMGLINLLAKDYFIEQIYDTQ